MGNVAVYKRGTTDFYNQGLGVLSDVLTSELTQVVASSGSVSQQLVMEYPLDGYLSTELVEGALVRVSVSKDKGDFGVFEISDTLKDDSGTLTIYADAYYNRILRMSFDNGGVFKTFPSVQLALDEARSAITGFPAGFALTSNLGKAVDLSAKTYETFGDFLEALVSASGGNAKYTLNGIQIYSALGKDITNIILRDDMNTTSVKVKTDYSGIINKVIPVLPGKDDSGNNTQDTVVGQVVTSKYGQQFLDYWAGKVIAFDTQDLANSYFDRTHADRPVQTVEVSPLDMDEDFSSINIFDRITLYSTKLDYKNKLRVSERVFDTLSEEVKSFKLGSSTANMFNQINEQNETLFNNVKNVTNALISANGKGLDYFGQAQPENPKEGDLWFWDDGTDSGIKQFVDGEWVSLVELATAKKVADSVAKALLVATNYSDKLVADNAEQVNAVLDDVQAKQADLTAQQAELDTKAQGYANKALADAKADTLATATQTAKDAQEYTDTAKAEAISVATTADGVINKKIDDTASSITRTISQNKSDADGRISTAQSTATQALDGLTQKVSQNTYDAKVNELTGKVSTAQQTADGAVTTIGNYKQYNDGRVASAESAIQQNASAITQKVSRTDYDQKTGELSGKISEISQTAENISQSVSDVKTQVDGLSVGGGVNLLQGTGTASGDVSQGGGIFAKGAFNGYDAVKTSTAWSERYINLKSALGRTNAKAGDWFTISVYVKADKQIDTGSLSVYRALGNSDAYANDGHLDGILMSNKPITTQWQQYAWSFQINNISLQRQATRVEYNNDTSDNWIYWAGWVLEKGIVAHDWSPAPKDTDNKISTVSQTVDSISSIVSDPTTGLTKRVQTAEGTLSQVTGSDIPNLQKATFWQPYSSLDLDTYTKQGSFFFASTDTKLHGPTSMTNWMYLVVEQGTSGSERLVQTVWYDTPYEAKITYRRIFNGGWGPWYANDNDSVTSISQSNETIRTEISNRQTGDDNTLTLAKNFTTSSISNSESGMKSLVTQTSDAILGKVGAVNLFPNSEFEKDYGYSRLNGNTTLSLITKNDVDGHINGTFTVTSTAQDWQGYWARNIPVYGGHSYSASVLVHYTNGGLSNGKALLDIWFVDKDGNRISSGTIGTGGSNVFDTGEVSWPWWVKLHIENLIAPTNAVNMQVSLIVNNAGAGQTAMFAQPMVTATEKLQPYTPNNDITTQIALLKDNWSIGITSNTGAIASGIAADTNAMNIVSPKVIISSPQTQITGTAWIKTAMIADGQISTAKIGDASITSAKILNLDVNKVTGNTSNWVLSQWTSATGNQVTIDGNGLYFSPGTSRMTTYGFEAWRRESGGNYAAMGMLGSYAWETNSDINGVGLIAKYYGVPHDDPNGPWKGEVWGGDTIAIGALEPQIGRGYNYVTPYMIFPSSSGIGDKYFPGNGNDTIIMSRWLSIYTGLNMRGHSIVNSSGYSLKENFRPISGSDALDIFDNTEIMTYDYKPDTDDMDERTEANRKDKVGFVINDNSESPFKTDPRLVRYGNTRDDSVTVGYLMSAVKELHAKVKELETKLEAQK